MEKKICFFGLLHIKKNENKLLNFKIKNEESKILVYLKNAIVLDQQLKSFDFEFVLLTNNLIYLDKLLKKLDYKIKLKKIKFKTYVPKNTHFYACHFRVDVFRYLSGLRNTYSILIDLDVLIFKKPLNLLNYKNKNINFVNDITKNVIPAYGKSKILKNLKILNSKIKNIKWYGGDFFSGDATFFDILYKKTNQYQKKFIKNAKLLTDQTDELFMSAAIWDIKYNHKFFKIKTIENTKIFTRYWNANTLHEQKEISYYKKFYMLHIPADKIFLSNFFNLLNKKKNFKIDYFNHVSIIKNFFKKSISKILPNNIKIKIKNYFI